MKTFRYMVFGVLALMGWMIALGPVPSAAKDDHTVTYSPCAPDQQAGETCLLAADQVHPTQANVGVIQVQCKYYKFSKKSGDEMGEYLNEWDHHVPAVIGPDGNFYITDHHHLSTALWLVQGKGQHTSWSLRMNVLNTFFDPSKKQPPTAEAMNEFWRYMIENNLTYLYDNGDPITWNDLPASVSGLTDDPYRSLAGFQKNDGLEGFIKPITNAMYFLEFKWGGLMRSNQVLGQQPADIPACALNVNDANLWYEGGDGNTCAQQASLQTDKLRDAFSLITSPAAGTAMISQCMNSREGVDELCGYNPNAVYPYSNGVRITKKCNVKDAD